MISRRAADHLGFLQLGDGGAYGLLARRFHPSLGTLHSVATGVEFLADRLELRAQPDKHRDTVLLLVLDATTIFVTEAAMTLRAAGYSVACHVVKGSLRPVLRQLPSDFEYRAVLGAFEEASRQSVLRSTAVGTEFTAQAP